MRSLSETNSGRNFSEKIFDTTIFYEPYHEQVDKIPTTLSVIQSVFEKIKFEKRQ